MASKINNTKADTNENHRKIYTLKLTSNHVNKDSLIAGSISLEISQQTNTSILQGAIEASELTSCSR